MRRARTRPAARTASRTATSTSRAWRRSTSRRRTTTAQPRATSSKAQVILVGVSRCGKTPTSLYLALQFGIRTANFPLTPDDFVDRKLPASILPHKDRLFGLTIQPERLREIREERRPGSKYAVARQLPLRSARGRAPDGARAHPDARHDDEVDRGDRDDDPAPHRAAPERVLAKLVSFPRRRDPSVFKVTGPSPSRGRRGQDVGVVPAL